MDVQLVLAGRAACTRMRSSVGMMCRRRVPVRHGRIWEPAVITHVDRRPCVRVRTIGRIRAFARDLTAAVTWHAWPRGNQRCMHACISSFLSREPEPNESFISFTVSQHRDRALYLRYMHTRYQLRVMVMHACLASLRSRSLLRLVTQRPGEKATAT